MWRVWCRVVSWHRCRLQTGTPRRSAAGGEANLHVRGHTSLKHTPQPQGSFSTQMEHSNYSRVRTRERLQVQRWPACSAHTAFFLLLASNISETPIIVCSLCSNGNWFVVCLSFVYCCCGLENMDTMFSLLECMCLPFGNCVKALSDAFRGKLETNAHVNETTHLTGRRNA